MSITSWKVYEIMESMIIDFLLLISIFLFGVAKKSIYTESQNEETLQRLQYLEDASRYQRKTTTEEIVTQAPVFTMPIKDLRVAENQAAHFEARVIPVGDSKLKVEWLRNGVPIAACKFYSTI